MTTKAGTDTTLDLVATSLQAEERLVERAASAGGCVLGRVVMTPLDLAREVGPAPTADPAWIAPGKPLDAAAMRLLVARVVSELAAGPASPVLIALARFPGYAGLLARSFAELARSRITPAELTRLVATASPRLRAASAERLQVLARLHDSVQRRLRELSQVDADDLLAQAAARLEAGAPAFAGRSPPRLEVRGFAELSPVQVALVGALARRVPVTVHLPSGPGAPELFTGPLRTRRRLAQAAPGVEVRPWRPRATGVLAAALDRFRSAPEDAAEESHAPLVPDGTLAILRCGSPLEQADAIGRTVAHLLEEGAEPHRIAIVVRAQDAAARLIAAVLARLRIPHRARSGEKLAAHPLARTLRAALEIPAGGWRRDAVLDLAFCGYSRPAPRARLERRDVDEVLDGAFVDALTPGGPWTARVDAWVARTAAADAARGQSPRAGRDAASRAARSRALLEPLLERLAALDEPRRPDEFIERVQELMRYLDVRRAALDRHEDALLAREAAGVAALDELLRELPWLLRRLDMANRALDAFTLRSILDEMLTERSYHPEPRAPSGVRLLLAEDAAGLDLDHVLLAGVVEGNWPAPPPHDPLLSEAERDALNHAALESGHDEPILRSAADHRASEPLLFWHLMATAARRLTLFVPGTDEGGRETSASPFVADLLALFGPHAGDPALVTSLSAGQSVPAAGDCRTPGDLVARTVADVFEPGAVADPAVAALLAAVHAHPALTGPLRHALDAAAIEQAREEFFLEERPDRRRERAGPYTGLLRRPGAADLLADPAARAADPVLARLGAQFDVGGALSATALEAYGKCPYHFFVGKVLRLEAPVPLEADLERKEEGILIHSVLDHVFRALRGDSVKRDAPFAVRLDDHTRQVARAATEAALEEWAGTHHTGHPELWRLRARELHGQVERILEFEEAHADEGWEPAAFELAFGPGEHTDAPAVEIRTPWGTQLTLRGKIDRVDVAPGAVRVVDYKNTSDPGNTYRKLLKDESAGVTNFQMPVYLLAARQWLEARGDTAGRLSAVYYGIKGPAVEAAKEGARVVSPQWLDPAVRPEADTLGGAMVRTARSFLTGTFDVTPRDCQHCDYAALCRYLPADVQSEEGSE